MSTIDGNKKILSVTAEEIEGAVTKLGEIEGMLGEENLPTTSQTLKGAVNELKELIDNSTSSLTNQNGGGNLKIWAGSKAEYDALSIKYDDVVYLIDENSTSTTIECTGLSLNKSTLTFTDNNSQTLTATKTPSNTTKSLTWSVSPGGIVTVSAGVVTPVSNGSALITATCGSQTATCNVTVNIETPITKYTITNNLTNVTSNNSTTSANENDSYSAILTANSGYELSNVTVTMGETDITTTAYSNGSINISSVTGNIVITATATENASTQEDTVIINKYYSSTGELVQGETGIDGIYDISSTLYRTVTPGTIVTITTPSAYKHTICEYDSSKTFIKRNKNTATNLSEYSVTLSDTTAYVRIGIGSVTPKGELEETLKASYDSTTITNANPSSCSSQNIVTE